MRSLKCHVQLPYPTQKTSLPSFMTDERTLCCQTLLCSMFKGLDGVAFLVKVKSDCIAMPYGEQTSEVKTDFFPGAAWTQTCSCCSFHFSNLLFLGALKWLCCSPEV